MNGIAGQAGTEAMSFLPFFPQRLGADCHDFGPDADIGAFLSSLGSRVLFFFFFSWPRVSVLQALFLFSTSAPQSQCPFFLSSRRTTESFLLSPFPPFRQLCDWRYRLSPFPPSPTRSATLGQHAMVAASFFSHFFKRRDRVFFLPFVVNNKAEKKAPLSSRDCTAAEKTLFPPCETIK